MIPPRPERPTREELLASWAKTTALLEAAKSALPADRLREYEEYIAHNELELALDELERIGDESLPPPQFWQGLIAAAENMKLVDRCDQLRRNLDLEKH